MTSDRYFSSDPKQCAIAVDLYSQVAAAPLVCPHGHVDPRLFADPDYVFGSPTDLFLIPDHYVFRMLYSQGISLESLGIPRRDGGPIESDHRKIWQAFADHFYLFRGTPTGVWLGDELRDIFDVSERLSGESAQRIYDRLAAQLASPAFRPRALYDRFNIKVLCTTDAATDPLTYHQAIRKSGWHGDIRPTFRPDGVVNLDAPGWRANIDSLAALCGEVNDYRSFIAALEDRRAFFKTQGAVATDHAVLEPYTDELTVAGASDIFARALRGEASTADVRCFSGHMLMELARMSVEDGLVMQIHPGALRDHNQGIYQRFGRDMGADMPVATEYTRNLRPLLGKYGNDARLMLILFTLDETSYGRELAPLAGHYPALKLGPPWWFFDSLNGLSRYFDLVMETAGLYNTAGFNDDTRAFASIPARHDLWRRASANWLAGLVARQIVSLDDAGDMVHDMATGLAQKAYKL